MAGPVHETAAEVQTIATKRSAEADPEPSPVAKRPTEVPQQKEQEAQPAQDTANVNVGYFSPYKRRPKMTLYVDEKPIGFPTSFATCHSYIGWDPHLNFMWKLILALVKIN
jgi:hypothetical protein